MPVPAPVATLLLDLDNTLYPASSGLFAAIDRRITDYLEDRFSIGLEDALRMRARLRRDHHITLVGLMAEHGVAPDDFLEYVHDLPLERFIGPDPILASFLETRPAPSYVFTNGSRAHAERVLRRLGLEGMVDGIFDIGAVGYVP